MPRHGGRHYVLVKGAEKAMDAFKMEIAEDLGLADKIKDGTFKKLTTEEVGKIGGEIVRRMQAAGEYAIKQRYDAGESRLMPNLPVPGSMRDVSNTGKTTPILEQ